MNVGALPGRRTEEVDCHLEIACTPEEMYAHVSLDGADIQPGDVVLVHAAPAQVDYGQRVDCARRATIVRAGLLARTWMRLRGYFALSALYEVSFSPARFAVAPDREALRAKPARNRERTIHIAANPAALWRAKMSRRRLA